MGLELAKENKQYEGLATKFFQHYIYVGAAMKRRGGRDYSLWDEKDGFFYDVLRYPDGSFHKFRVRSLVGIIPLYAIERIEPSKIHELPIFLDDVHWFMKNRADLVGQACYRAHRDGRTLEVLSIVDR